MKLQHTIKFMDVFNMATTLPACDNNTRAAVVTAALLVSEDGWTVVKGSNASRAAEDVARGIVFG